MYIARVTFWNQDKGGRFTPPQSGFKPQLEIGDIHTSCFVYSQEKIEAFEFNKPLVVKLELMFPDEYGGQLKIGDKVKLYEGSKQIGDGEIIGLY